MRVFVTGATGFIGSAVVQDLLAAGHQVLGLARSDAGAQALAAAGAQVHRGHLEDLESLRSGAAKSDGVIHTAFIHDFSKFKEVCEIDQRAIQALGGALAGSDRPLVVSSGMPPTPGRPTTEDDVVPVGALPTPRVSEQVALGMIVPGEVVPGEVVPGMPASGKLAPGTVAFGPRVSVVRLPQVHDTRKQGLVSYLIAVARQKGVSAYVADGLNRWPAVHRLDTAPLYRLALEKGSAGARYHAVAEEGVPVREIAEAIGRRLNLPVVSKSREEAAAHFGFLGLFAAMDLPASSLLTQQRLGWRPSANPGMIADLDQATL